MSKSGPKIRWRDETAEHDYPAAESYLSLLMPPQAAKAAVEALAKAELRKFAAKDIFRAPALSLLGVGNSHVEKDRTRIIKKEQLTPLLLVVPAGGGRVVIADGYHRMCAVYTFDEDAMIPCRLIYEDATSVAVDLA